jgi:putative transposase
MTEKSGIDYIFVITERSVFNTHTMFKSKYSVDEQRQILKEKNKYGISVANLCKKYGITVQTYYKWKHRYENDTVPEITIESSAEEQNSKLKKLYFDLSAHNLELAKFLNK